MLVNVDADICIGSGQCVLIAPDVFDQDDEEGTVIVLTDVIAAGGEQRVREAAASCPARVITLDG
jgi:ferredoxin